MRGFASTQGPSPKIFHDFIGTRSFHRVESAQNVVGARPRWDEREATMLGFSVLPRRDTDIRLLRRDPSACSCRSAARRST